MKYVALIYGNATAEASMSQEQQALFQAHLAYAQELRERGVMAGGEALLPTSAADAQALLVWLESLDCPRG